MMKPFSEYIVKVASRCNLNCSYCYEYNLGDDSWQKQPKKMAAGTMEQLASRIREHSLSHDVSEVYVGLHGGEPLLLGADLLDKLCSTLCASLNDVCKLTLGLQTNATIITSDLIDVIRRHKVLVSVSLDGPRSSNDLHRLDHGGRSSFEATMAGIQALKARAPTQLIGALCVIDIRVDPVETFNFFRSLGLSSIDFLLPHATWDRLPFRPNQDPVAYGRWYLKVFETWVADTNPYLEIRSLHNIVRRLVGGTPIVESMALTPCQIVTVATNGEIEAVDCLKSSFGGIQATGLNIHDSSFDEALKSPLIAVRQTGEEQLCTTCKTCTNMPVCAGGYIPHRFSRINAFNNPSVYCADLFWLIDHIRQYLYRGAVA